MLGHLEVYHLPGVTTYFWQYEIDELNRSFDPFSRWEFDPVLLRLSSAMTAQSVVKHFLTEGDKFVISRISALEDQGGYAIASNYGQPFPIPLIRAGLFI